ncbi:MULTISPECIES: hypothetical protein [unclassified Aminobacter]|uniref:hypothetical protein n=1 Tax=unclassified Aminobacter TaxID=2644704 RepID=UPI0004B9F730|nr:MULTISPECIES: hypothetical protein [unclassified Aminobacter]TWH35608.1 hypothetical protein L611_001200000890 [Aminobacter sp. J15]
MVQIDEQFHSLEDARRFVRRTYRKYRPIEYGTKLHIRREIQGFSVIGWRF